MMLQLTFREDRNGDETMLLSISSAAAPDVGERVAINGQLYTVIERTWEFETPKTPGGVYAFAYLWVKKLTKKA